ncbi:MAG TPA: PKD domain-containing protein [Nocardioidaceae bacterium]|jgi:PKD repeat protein|nr:PKD domain-containing protein [Nocardioidaceae bacterium]
MRPIGMPAVLAGVLLAALACGGDGGGNVTPSENAAPVASFDLPSCIVGAACDFVSTSTDDAAVTTWSWDFNGDGTPDATTAAAAFTYDAAGSYDVTLTVHDAQGLSGTKASTITVTTVAPPNTPPTAGFTQTCTALDCSFTSTSTDASPGTIAAYAWTFGDGGTADVAAPSHSYTVNASTDFTVTLTVTDDQGASASTSETITVVPPPPPNTPPTAGFTHTCTANVCKFTSTSTDAAPGTIAALAWAFGDGHTSSVTSPTNTYSVMNPTTDFTVTLTATDNDGATDVETQTITVSAPAWGPEGCTTSGTRIECGLDVTARSAIALKLIGVSCNLLGQRITIPPPSRDQVFLNVCARVAGDSTKIFGGVGDAAFVFEAGGRVRIWFDQGTPRSGEPAVAPPAAQITGSFPNWVIHYEDGARPADPGEPDFADVVLQVDAIPPPR